MLHAANLSMPPGLLGTAAGAAGIVPGTAGLLLNGIGAIGGMTVTVMMRATRGHAGGNLDAGYWLAAATARGRRRGAVASHGGASPRPRRHRSLRGALDPWLPRACSTAGIGRRSRAHGAGPPSSVVMTVGTAVLLAIVAMVGAEIPSGHN